MEDKTAEITPRSSVEEQPEKTSIPKPKQGERMGAETWAGFKRIGRRAGRVTLRSSVTGKVLTLAEDSAAYQGWCQWHGKNTPAEEKALAEQEAKTDADDVAIMVDNLKEHIRETRIDRQAVIERYKEERAAEEPKEVCEVCFSDEYPEGQIQVCEACGVPFGPCCNSETDGLCVDCV